MKITKSTIKTEAIYDNDLNNKFLIKRMESVREKGCCHHEKGIGIW
ncbi:hypothetical protein MH052_14645 [Bacillus altitudinis]|nr:hypothetical protein [Bacillus altitudinis]MCY7714227.1 hypothetical protein [Bacillus altitudinis]